MSARALLDAFRTAGILRPLDVHLAEALGRVAQEHDPLALLGVAAASRVHGAGHVCLELGSFRDQVRDEALEEDGQLAWPAPATWREVLAGSPLVRTPTSDERTPLVLDGERLYLDRYWGYQQRLIAEVTSRVESLKTDIDEDALQTALNRLFPPMAEVEGEDLQRKAAETAIRRGFTIITGGPGTGKTTTIKRLMALMIQAAWDRGAPTPRFALMAPTGKAAARMKESIRETGSGPGLHASDEVKDALPGEASTIHRALGFNPRHPTRFRRDGETPLDADVIIVDEASMVDLALMVKLFEAVPRHARLVLLGDADQLKSVESGAVLGDLCRALDEGVVRLTYTHRFGADSGIGALSRAINAQAPDRALSLLRQEVTEHPDGVMYDELTWISLETEDNPRKLREHIASHLRPIVLEETRPFHRAIAAGDLATALSAMDRFRVLAAHRRGDLGVHGLNSAIQQWLTRAGRISPTKGEEFYVGRPIIVVENDREQDLYNGDVGFITTDPAGKFIAIFPAPADTPYRQVPVARLPPHQTVYAMTVHKSQGSQLTHALVALPMEPSRIITRELLYTGVTRAAKRVTVIGHENTLKHGIEELVSRSSGLVEALQVSPEA